MWWILACSTPAAAPEVTEAPAPAAIAPDEPDPAPPAPLGAADVHALPESIRGWFRVAEMSYDGSVVFLGGVDVATWDRWQSQPYEPLAMSAGQASVWTLEARPSRLCARGQWQVYFRWASERRRESMKCELPDANAPRMDGETLVFDLGWDASDRERLCPPLGEVGGRKRMTVPGGGVAELRLRPLGGDRAEATICGHSVEMVIGESADDRFARWVREEAIRRVREIATRQAELKVGPGDAVTWRGEPVTCGLGFHGCRPDDVQVWCENEARRVDWDSPDGVAVRFGPSGPSSDVGSDKCLDTALLGI